jgi:hypothetical protein
MMRNHHAATLSAAIPSRCIVEQEQAAYWFIEVYGLLSNRYPSAHETVPAVVSQSYHADVGICYR